MYMYIDTTYYNVNVYFNIVRELMEKCISFYKCIQAYGRKDLNINTPTVTKRLIQAYYTKHSNVSTPSLISTCFFTVGLQAYPLILEIHVQCIGDYCGGGGLSFLLLICL